MSTRARNLIPFKGQVLNMISEWAFSQTKAHHRLYGVGLRGLRSMGIWSLASSKTLKGTEVWVLGFYGKIL